MMSMSLSLSRLPDDLVKRDTQTNTKALTQARRPRVIAPSLSRVITC